MKTQTPALSRPTPGTARLGLCAVLALCGLLQSAAPVRAQAPSPEKGTAVDLWSPLRREQTPPVRPSRSGQGPSSVVYPAGPVPLRFSHRLHLQRGARCESCHPGASTSTASRDNLLPSEDQCRSCHAIDRTRPFGLLFQAMPPGTPPTACAACHIGFPSEPARDGQPTLPVGTDPASRIARSDRPPPNLKFSHLLHGTLGIGCQTCHGDLSVVDGAGRAQLPSMDLCLRCHNGGKMRAKSPTAPAASADAPDKVAASGSAGSTGSAGPTGPTGSSRRASDRCSVCHPTQSSGLLQQQFPSGLLLPSGALRGDDHRENNFRSSHGLSAQGDPDYCASCHRESYCLRCHNAVAKPLDIHGGNYIARHAIDARRNQPDCSTCHRQQSFCLGCHERLAVVSHSTLPGRPPISAFSPAQPRRFHPEGWASVGGSPSENQHGAEARRNQRSCASCHREDTCLACHSTLPDSRVPGGANPHPIDWVGSGRCRALASHNPRVCLKCHRDGSAALSCP